MHKNLGMLLLAKGDFQRGWSELEWRLRCRDACLPPFAQPRWDGSPLDGQTILLHTEQGLGDALQLVRFARLVQQRGGRGNAPTAQAMRSAVRGVSVARVHGLTQNSGACNFLEVFLDRR